MSGLSLILNSQTNAEAKLLNEWERWNRGRPRKRLTEYMPSPIESLLDRVEFKCCCCSAPMGRCGCWLKYSKEFKRKGGKRIYECPHGCYKCSMHCKHAKVKMMQGNENVPKEMSLHPWPSHIGDHKEDVNCKIVGCRPKAKR